LACTRASKIEKKTKGSLEGTDFLHAAEHPHEETIIPRFSPHCYDRSKNSSFVAAKKARAISIHSEKSAPILKKHYARTNKTFIKIQKD